MTPRMTPVKRESEKIHVGLVPKSTECYRDVNLILCPHAGLRSNCKRRLEIQRLTNATCTLLTKTFSTHGLDVSLKTFSIAEQHTEALPGCSSHSADRSSSTKQAASWAVSHQREQSVEENVQRAVVEHGFLPATPWYGLSVCLFVCLFHCLTSS